MLPTKLSRKNSLIADKLLYMRHDTVDVLRRCVLALLAFVICPEILPGVRTEKIPIIHYTNESEGKHKLLSSVQMNCLEKEQRNYIIRTKVN